MGNIFVCDFNLYKSSGPFNTVEEAEQYVKDNNLTNIRMYKVNKDAFKKFDIKDLIPTTPSFTYGVELGNPQPFIIKDYIF